MDYGKEIFKRMDLQQICTFLLDGLENFDIENDTYENRIKKGSISIYERLENIYQNEDELDKAVADLSEAFVAYESVYTEIGMKFGARLIFQLLHKDNFTELDETKPK